MATLAARYGHTNVIARDWRRLASFYETVFGCTPVPPERDYSGDLAERGTGITGAAFRGVHLRLPGHGLDGPTLEIYSYATNVDPAATPTANRVGWGHIAFMVDDVSVARTAVLDAGGQPLPGAEVVTTRTADGRNVTWCYLADPEGNLIELQSWSPADSDG
jgi:catechol 2,3-dioxygenase-like lactoylglutathione lyase family enzyme